MARTPKKKAPTNKAAAPARRSKKAGAKKAAKKKGSKVGRKTDDEPEQNDDDLDIEDDTDEGDDDEEEEDDDDTDEGDDDEGDDEDDDEDEDEDEGASEGASSTDGKPRRERDKSPIAKRMAKRIAKALSGLRKRHAVVSEWNDADEIATELSVGIAAFETAISKLEAKPDDYKPKTRRARVQHTFAEGQLVRVAGKKSRELYEDIFGADQLDSLKVTRVKGKQAVVVSKDGHKQAMPLSCLAPAEEA